MVGQNLFHAACGQPVAGNVDDVVGARHDEYVAVVVDISGIRSFIKPRKFFQIGFDKSVVIVPQGGKRPRRERQFHHQRADFAGLYRFAVWIDHLNIPSRHRLCGRSLFNRKLFNTKAIGGDGPSGFRLPPVIDDRNLQLFFSPLKRIRVEPFSSQKQGLEIGEIIIFDEFPLGVPPA